MRYMSGWMMADTKTSGACSWTHFLKREFGKHRHLESRPRDHLAVARRNLNLQLVPPMNIP